uniref:Uncharacterized protein n=1 Tax=Rhizophora mucronata TaxID=61149 RepID=A0A2P2QKQ4_RHIMU
MCTYSLIHLFKQV